MDNTMSQLDLWMGRAEETGLLDQMTGLAGSSVTEEDLLAQSYDGKEDLIYASSVQKSGDDLLALIILKSEVNLAVLGKNKGNFKGTKRPEEIILIICIRT